MLVKLFRFTFDRGSPLFSANAIPCLVMSKLTEANLAEITALLQGVATEFAFLEPGCATGIEALQSALEALRTAAGPNASSSVTQELNAATALVNAAAEAGAFSDEILQELNAWYPRMETAIHHWIHTPEESTPSSPASEPSPAAPASAPSPELSPAKGNPRKNPC